MIKWLRWGCLFLGLWGASLSAEQCTGKDWPLWQQFNHHFIQENGRVLDASTPKQHSSSEGQSYGMFFSLIAGDKATFERLWQWSVDNLFEGDEKANLPAWVWGLDQKGKWGIIDRNSASDADLWFVYALLEAGRLWEEPQYTEAAYRLLAQIELKEVVDLPPLGAMLLPGEHGFIQEKYWILNPSYLPIPLLRRLQHESVLSQWEEIAANTMTMLQKTTPHGYVADWVGYPRADNQTEEPRFLSSLPDKEPIGSYDAIRNYLWAGMTPTADPLAAPILSALDGMYQYLKEGALAPPEKVNVKTGETSGQASFGFSAALLPYLMAHNDEALLDQQKKRAYVLLRQSLLPANTAVNQPPYYDFVLSLFGLGWLEGYYRFNTQGHLSVFWEKGQC